MKYGLILWDQNTTNHAKQMQQETSQETINREKTISYMLSNVILQELQTSPKDKTYLYVQQN